MKLTGNLLICLCAILPIAKSYAYYDVTVGQTSTGNPYASASNVDGFHPDSFELEATNGVWKVWMSGGNQVFTCNISPSNPLYENIKVAAARVRDMRTFSVYKTSSGSTECGQIALAIETRDAAYSVTDPDAFPFYYSISGGSATRQFGAPPASAQGDYVRFTLYLTNTWRITVHNDGASPADVYCHITSTSNLADDLRALIANMIDFHALNIATVSSTNRNCAILHSKYLSND